MKSFYDSWFFLESLKAICEAFTVAMDIAGIPPVPFKQGQALDKRKSKVINSGTSSSNIYLDIMSLPQMTRNVSESQLLSLKNVGKYWFLSDNKLHGVFMLFPF